MTILAGKTRCRSINRWDPVELDKRPANVQMAPRASIHSAGIHSSHPCNSCIDSGGDFFHDSCGVQRFVEPDTRAVGRARFV